MLAKWSADEEWWLRYNCKTFAALKAPALAPYTANTARADASPAPSRADASPAPTTRAKAKKAEAANKPAAAAAAELRALNQMMLSRTTPGARRAHVEMEKEEGAAPNSTTLYRRHRNNGATRTAA